MYFVMCVMMCVMMYVIKLWCYWLCEGVCTKSEIDSIKTIVNETIDKDFAASKTW